MSRASFPTLPPLYTLRKVNDTFEARKEGGTKILGE